MTESWHIKISLKLSLSVDEKRVMENALETSVKYDRPIVVKSENKFHVRLSHVALFYLYL
jgi:hypothetical protein